MNILRQIIFSLKNRDRQRSRVYSAEHYAEKASPRYTHFAPMKSGKTTVKSLIAKSTGDARINATISFRKSDTLQSWASCGVINLCIRNGMLSDYEVLHELAHLLQGEGGADHGKEFASIFLLLVKQGLPQECYDALLTGYKIHRVKYEIMKEGEL